MDMFLEFEVVKIFYLLMSFLLINDNYQNVYYLKLLLQYLGYLKNLINIKM